MIPAQHAKIITSSIQRKILTLAINAHKTVLNVIAQVNCARHVLQDTL